MLYLIRHTSVSVPKNTCYGQTDVPLATTFEGELEAVRQQLEGLKYDRVFSSPLSRCVKLARRFVGEKELILDKRLMEMNFGDWEMKNWDDIHYSDQGKEWFGQYTTARCPNGESFADMTARVREFYEEIKKRSRAGEKVAIFTHAGVIRSFMTILEGVSPEETFERSVSYGQLLVMQDDL